MDYVEPADAQHLPGLRLALTAHAPAPYSLSARAILDGLHSGELRVPRDATGRWLADLARWVYGEGNVEIIEG